jgi:hypothetical protein
LHSVQRIQEVRGQEGAVLGEGEEKVASSAATDAFTADRVDESVERIERCGRQGERFLSGEALA